jgi:hypothetical protein
MGIAATARAANDWVVLGLINAGVSAGTAGAVWLFGFKSQKAQVNCTYGSQDLALGSVLAFCPWTLPNPKMGIAYMGGATFPRVTLMGQMAR